MYAPGSTSTYPLIYCVSYSTHLPLPPTCLPSQPGIKTGWHLTKGINHPWPWTNYPSLPTLCLPLKGELCNNSTTWKSVALRALMDTPVRPCLLRSPGRLTFKSLSLSNSTRTKEAIVQDQGLWPLEMKCRAAGNERAPCWKWMIEGLGEQESVETREVFQFLFCLFCSTFLLDILLLMVCTLKVINYIWNVYL